MAMHSRNRECQLGIQSYPTSLSGYKQSCSTTATTSPCEGEMLHWTAFIKSGLFLEGHALEAAYRRS